VRGKVAAVANRAGLAPDSHLGKALTHILEMYPRDELFQIPLDDLYETSMGILQLGERQRFRLFVRRDPFDRFVSCLIYVPRENYGTELRRRFIDILMQRVQRPVERVRRAADRRHLARMHITVRTTPGQVPRWTAARSSRSSRRRRAAGKTSCAMR
jgi:glutamate dehydrogenase